MENIIDRLEKYMTLRGLNNNQMTVQAGLSIGLIGKARETRKGLHSESIEKILCAYADINPAWLMTGKGNMLLAGQDQLELKTDVDLHKRIKEYQAEIKDLCKQIGRLEHQIEILGGKKQGKLSIAAEAEVKYKKRKK